MPKLAKGSSCSILQDNATLASQIRAEILGGFFLASGTTHKGERCLRTVVLEKGNRKLSIDNSQQSWAKPSFRAQALGNSG